MSQETKPEDVQPPAVVEEVSKVEETPVEAAKTEEVTKEETKEESKEESKEEAKDETKEEATEFKPEDVLKQVEFYFSDSNLPKDKFLWRTVQSNTEGWVPINTIASFNRMKKFRPLDAVVAALRTSEFLVVSEDGELLKRKNPILPPKESEKQLRFQRSVYAKGFGEETTTSQEDIEKWFSQFGKVNEVRLRRDDSKKFKESVFAEFNDLEDAKKFLELNPKPKYLENELLIMSKPAYVELKAQNQNFGGANNKRKFNGFKQKRGFNNKRQRN